MRFSKSSTILDAINVIWASGSSAASTRHESGHGLDEHGHGADRLRGNPFASLPAPVSRALRLAHRAIPDGRPECPVARSEPSGGSLDIEHGARGERGHRG